MNASFARRLSNFQEMLVALSAPTLLRDNPLRPPVAAAAPLANSLTLRELAILARLRTQAVA
jgi:hypothetical protein